VTVGPEVISPGAALQRAKSGASPSRSGATYFFARQLGTSAPLSQSVSRSRVARER
jgi:hypothetical protein